MGRLKAIIFDVDGTLAETEEHGHLPACNDAFASLGIPVRWTVDEFREMQVIPGNRHRMRIALEHLQPPMAPEAIEAAVKELFTLKQRYYIEKYVPRLQLRPGVRQIVEQAAARDIRLAVVSTSDEPQIHALLQARLPEYYARFQPILGKLAGVKTAPDSPLHRRCLHELNVAPGEALAIEDFHAGLDAARRAGIPCAVFYNGFTAEDAFKGAALVARSMEFFDLDQLIALCMP